MSFHILVQQTSCDIHHIHLSSHCILLSGHHDHWNIQCWIQHVLLRILHGIPQSIHHMSFHILVQQTSCDIHHIHLSSHCILLSGHPDHWNIQCWIQHDLLRILHGIPQSIHHMRFHILVQQTSCDIHHIHLSSHYILLSGHHDHWNIQCWIQ